MDGTGARDQPRDGEPRVGRKALFFLLVGLAIGFFVGWWALGLIALIWILTVLVWVLAGRLRSRVVLYLGLLTSGFTFAVFILPQLHFPIP